MSFVYISLTDTFGPPLVKAQQQSQSSWTTPSKLSNFLHRLDSLDFSDYDSRRSALYQISSLRIPQFFFTYPFNPLLWPFFPPQLQTRFPSFQSYIFLDSNEYQTQINVLQATLSYRDTDGPILPIQTSFSTALFQLHSLFNSQIQQFDQIGWEASNLLVWSIYPIPPPLNGLRVDSSKPK
jgi:hypothetical protein